VVTPIPADLSRLHVVVPVRGLSDGKVRLGIALDAEERQTLVVGMLVSTLLVLRDWPDSSGVHVVSGDQLVLDLARSLGATGVADDGAGDLNPAVVAGRRSAESAGATAVLCLPADLPVLTHDSLDRLLHAADAALAAGRGRPLVVVAPADARDGTNALLLSPVDIIEPAFGADSLAAHLRAAALADASVQVVVDADLGFDLDTPDDLERMEEKRLLELLVIGGECLARFDPGTREHPAVTPLPAAAKNR
jgi:2-phospho-L-lactate guanylyltransferase